MLLIGVKHLSTHTINLINFFLEFFPSIIIIEIGVGGGYLRDIMILS